MYRRFISWIDEIARDILPSETIRQWCNTFRQLYEISFSNRAVDADCADQIENWVDKICRSDFDNRIGIAIHINESSIPKCDS